MLRNVVTDYNYGINCFTSHTKYTMKTKQITAGLRQTNLLTVNDGKEIESVYNSCSLPRGPYT